MKKNLSRFFKWLAEMSDEFTADFWDKPLILIMLMFFGLAIMVALFAGFVFGIYSMPNKTTINIAIYILGISPILIPAEYFLNRIIEDSNWHLVNHH